MSVAPVAFGRLLSFIQLVLGHQRPAGNATRESGYFCEDGVCECMRALHAIFMKTFLAISAPRPWFRLKLGHDLREIHATVRPRETTN